MLLIHNIQIILCTDVNQIVTISLNLRLVKTEFVMLNVLTVSYQLMVNVQYKVNVQLEVKVTMYSYQDSKIRVFALKNVIVK